MGGTGHWQQLAAANQGAARAEHGAEAARAKREELARTLRGFQSEAAAAQVSVACPSSRLQVTEIALEAKCRGECDSVTCDSTT